MYRFSLQTSHSYSSSCCCAFLALSTILSTLLTPRSPIMVRFTYSLSRIRSMCGFTFFSTAREVSSC